jgi:hypothetical protein
MKFYLFSVFLIFTTAFGNAQNIAATGNWSSSIAATSITEAGSNYTANATSATNQTLVSFNVPAGLFGATYQVFVHKLDATWNSNLSLWTRRTGNGTSNAFFGGSISGGTTFLQLTNSPQLLCNGTTGILGNGRDNIPMQHEIRGISVIVPVRTYTTTVVYTVSN